MKELLKKLAQLRQRAAAKAAEITDDTSEEAARALDAEHQAIITEIDQTIRAMEALAEADEERPSPPRAPDVATERARSAEITRMAQRHGMPDVFAGEHIAAGTNIEEVRRLVLDHVAAEDRRTRTLPHTRGLTDEQETRRNAMVEALSYGLGAPLPANGPSNAARQYMGRGLVDLAAECVDYRTGRVLNARQIDEIFTRASHTTSDFPAIFEGAVNRTLEQRYRIAEPTYRRIARKRNFRDFRPDTTVKLGDFPLLKKVLESGEIKYGTFSEGKEQVQAFSYAIALRVTRQMLINDDLGAITELLSSYGVTVALFEEITFYSSALNASLADGNPVFHASHANLAGAGTVIDVSNVGKARAAMSKQKTLEGNPMLTNPARILLVGPDKLTEAEMLVASITPATVSTVNVFSGRLEPLETMQITGNNWYLFPDSSAGNSNYRWGYLEGYEAPRVRMDEPFGQQGFAMSVEHDFGCGATDYRYGYKNPGA